jgi:hypothetical protein
VEEIEVILHVAIKCGNFRRNRKRL